MRPMTRKMAKDMGITLSEDSGLKPRKREDSMMIGERFYRIESIDNSTDSIEST